ncbi:MAG TPA: tRNA (N(6)-L-threonylcarbamoyladenosine(37)-C(2))-methylthiotransferase MtaB [Lachnospiraceae bacterium]|nr:tRNA (N(6)-L-threonylcarbamoyladenosine(37)-C(2))-methylthiotransferase MtaB [Lachnospiraceae bacterium]
MLRKAALHNLGCKVNSYELEAMQQALENAGYRIVPFEPGADVYVINTCTVTNIADRKSRQMLHKARGMNPDAVVVAVGCYAQMRGKELEKDPVIDLIIGSDRKGDLVQELERYFAGGGRRTDTSEIRKDREIEKLETDRAEGHTRAFLKVQDGCNQFCSYCIIPYARGRVRSRKIADVVQETERLVASGVQEVVLTGIHLCSYGKDLGEGEDLSALIRAVHQVEGICRIRLGSLEPGSIDEAFVKNMAELPKVCPHFHLSLQSGCSRTLQRMNRKYTPEEFAQTCALLRRYFRHPAICTDIITGFPGETEEDFEECRSFVEKMHFFETHIFPYSRREGTRAAAFPDQIPEAVKKERGAVLRDLDRKRREEFLKYYCGMPMEVLFEETVTEGGRSWWLGHGKEYQKVLLPADDPGIPAEGLSNRILSVKPEKISFHDCLTV